MAPFASKKRKPEPVFLSSKKRKLAQPTELLFDPSARNEYLTGFHKRKVARQESARETAKKLEKEEKVVQRRQLREERKLDLQKHVEEFDEELRKMDPDRIVAEENSDVDEADTEIRPPEPVAEDAEYIDEDLFTTVTVESLDGPDASVVALAEEDAARAAAAKLKPPIDDKKGKKKVEKPKKKAFRYESKVERQATRQKLKGKNQAAKAKREEGKEGAERQGRGGRVKGAARKLKKLKK